MKVYAQIVDDYIVMITEKQYDGMIEIEIPDDFDYDHINWYEYSNGELIYHDLSIDIPPIPSYEERITALEEQNALLLEQLAMYESSYHLGVQEA